jgi:hypothetical protein
VGIFKLNLKYKKNEAGVAQLGQRRKVEGLIPKGFVGSNPISRIFFKDQDKLKNKHNYNQKKV